MTIPTPAKVKFLIALTNSLKTGAIKRLKQALDFARREFGEVDDAFFNDILNVFKKQGKTKKSDVVPIKKNPLEDVIDKKFGKDTYKKAIDPDEGIVAADAAKEIVKKRTKDIAKGDVEGTGVESLETSIKKIKETAEELKKSTLTPESMFENMIKSQRVMAEGYKTGNIRTAVREFMRSEEKAGRLKLNETDSFRIREYSPRTEDDPIDVFRRHYGEDALEAVDEIGDVFQQGESFSHYEQLLRENVDPKILTVKKTGAGEYDASVVAGEKIRKAMEEEAKNLKILEEFDPKDRTKNADGGLIDILKL